VKVTRLLHRTAFLVLATAAPAVAQTATQTVTWQVDPVNQVGLTGAPTMSITAAVAGNAPTTVTSSGHSWAVTTNQSTAKVTASLATAMPSGLTLSASLTAPPGATSAGLVPLGTAPVDVVTGITRLNVSGLSLSYQLSATSAAGVVSSTSSVVTYTITGGV
jgi:hypothetical protein